MLEFNPEVTVKSRDGHVRRSSDATRTQQAKPHRVPRCPFQGNISRYWVGREVEGEADEIRLMTVDRSKYYPS